MSIGTYYLVISMAYYEIAWVYCRLRSSFAVLQHRALLW